MDHTDADALVGKIVIGTGGEELGTVDAVLAEDETGELEWVVLTRAGSPTAPVPLAGSETDGATLAVPYDAHAVRTAPVPAAERLTPEERAALLAHYGLPGGGEHPAGRHSGLEDDRAERDEVAAGADGFTAAGRPDAGEDGVPGVRSA